MFLRYREFPVMATKGGGGDDDDIVINPFSVADSTDASAAPAISSSEEALLTELRYWLVLFVVFTLLSSFYAGLVTCFHLVYCAKFDSGCACRRDNGDEANSVGHASALANGDDSSGVYPSSVDPSLLAPPPSYETVILVTPPKEDDGDATPPPSYYSTPTAGASSLSPPDYPTALRAEIRSVSLSVEAEMVSGDEGRRPSRQDIEDAYRDCVERSQVPTDLHEFLHRVVDRLGRRI